MIEFEAFLRKLKKHTQPLDLDLPIVQVARLDMLQQKKMIGIDNVKIPLTTFV